MTWDLSEINDNRVFLSLFFFFWKIHNLPKQSSLLDIEMQWCCLLPNIEEGFYLLDCATWPNFFIQFLVNPRVYRSIGLTLWPPKIFRNIRNRGIHPVGEICNAKSKSIGKHSKPPAGGFRERNFKFHISQATTTKRHGIVYACRRIISINLSMHENEMVDRQ